MSVLTVVTSCPHCDSLFRVPRRLENKKATCSHCYADFNIRPCDDQPTKIRSQQLPVMRLAIALVEALPPNRRDRVLMHEVAMLATEYLREQEVESDVSSQELETALTIAFRI